jgi:HlyD family secretion protein
MYGLVPALASRMTAIAHRDADASPFGREPAGEHAAAPATPARARKWRTPGGIKRALRVIVGLAVVSVAGAFAFRTITRPATVHVGSAVAGTVAQETIGPGTVQSRYSVSLAFRVAGTIDRVLVDVGDEVHEGQILATLDRTELDARFRATRGAVASARQEIALATANLTKARSDLELARIRDKRAQRLAPAVISVADADDARGAARAAEANERAARAAVDARQAEMARLAQEQRVAETILSYTALSSPMEGVITRRALEPGSAVGPGAVVFQIVDANALWVATLIDQSLAGRVEIGQRATVRLRSGEQLGGHVARIAFEADPVTRELEVDVAFDARPSRFAIHEEADVTILGEQAQGLTIPLDVVSHGADGSGVFVVENGRARRRPVRLGVVGSRRAQVLGGISEAESLVLAPNTVQDGQRVAITGEGR